MNDASPRRSIEGHVAIVTGAASGIGKAIATTLAEHGANIVLADLEAPDAVAAAIDEATGRAATRPIACDVGTARQLADLVDIADEAWQRLDIIISNAGVAHPSPIATGTDDEFESVWQRTLDVNITSHARLARAAFHHLERSPAPRIVNIASTEALVATPGLAAYSTTKAAVTGLTRSMAVELGKFGITVNSILPGPIDTAMTAAIDDELKQAYAHRRVPLRRYGLPAEVADMVLNLCLPSASYVTGASIPVDGGMSVRHT